MVSPLLTYEVFASQRQGGISRYFSQLHQEFLNLGIPSLIVAPLWRSEPLRGLRSIVGHEMPPWLEARDKFRLARRTGQIVDPVAIWLRRLSRDDVVVHRTYFLSSWFHPRAPTAITVYDMIHEKHPGDFASNDATATAKRRWCDRADVVIAISEHTAQDVRVLLNISADRVKVVYPGATYLPPDDATLARLRQRRPFVLYVGNRAGYKNFLTLLRGYAQSATFQEGIDLVAFGGGPATAEELNYAADLGVDGRVVFTGGSDGALAAHYAAATALIYPSLEEGFGLPPLEAMLHRLPVAVARSGALPEVVGSAATYFDPTSPEDIADGVDRICGDQMLRQRLMDNGPVHAGKYSWAACAAGTLDAYQLARQNFAASP